MRFVKFAVATLTAPLFLASLSAQIVVDPTAPVITVRASDASATEGADSGVFTFLRQNSTNQDVRVFFSIGGTAQNGIDYVSIDDNIVIPAGVREARLEIVPIDDSLVEPDETVVLHLTPPPAGLPSPYAIYKIGTPAEAAVVIHDNDAPRDTNQPPKVELVSPTNNSVFIAPADIRIFANPTDVDGTVQTVEFFAGTTSLGIVTNNPFLMSPINPWNVNWTNVHAGAYLLWAKATDDKGAIGISPQVHIVVREPVPPPTVVTVVATDPDATEIPPVPPGQERPQLFDPAVFTFSRAGDTGFPVTVYYSLGGTAINGVDYDKLPGSITIPAGAISADVVVAPIDDALVEGTETVEISIQPAACVAIYPPPPGCYQIGLPARALAFIHDDDTNQVPTTVTVVATDPDGTEIPVVPPGMGLMQRWDPAVFTFSRKGETNSPLTVYYSLGGTAKNGVDYSNLPGSVTIPAGARSADVTVDPIDDLLIEGTETVEIAIRPAPCAAIVPPPPGCYQIGSPSSALAFIHDNDTEPGTNRPPFVKLISPRDGAEFRAPATIFLQASAGDPDGSVTSVVFYAGSDKIGQTDLPLPLASIGTPLIYGFAWSNVDAAKYVLTARAFDNQGASALSDPVNISVVTNFPPPPTNRLPVVTITAPDAFAAEGTNREPNTVGGSQNTATFAVHRDGPTNTSIVVFYAVGGSASNGVDYVTIPGTVTIPAGERSARIIITPIDDAIPEPTESVVLSLVPSPMASLPTYDIGFPAKAGAVIVDNDGLPLPTCQLPDGLFHLCIPCNNGFAYRIECSTGMTNWIPICTNVVVDGAIHFLEADTATAPHRFYRILPELNAPAE